jgi:hypothetical protein
LGKHVPHPADKSEETEPNTMFNKVILIGRLGQNAEAKTAQNNREYVVLNIATQESWKNDKGDYETRTEWHRVYAWRNLSKFARTLQKGHIWTRPACKSFLRWSQQERDAHIYPASDIGGRVFPPGHNGICASSPYQLSGLYRPAPSQVLKKLVSPVTPSLMAQASRREE